MKTPKILLKAVFNNTGNNPYDTKVPRCDGLCNAWIL